MKEKMYCFCLILILTLSTSNCRTVRFGYSFRTLDILTSFPGISFEECNEQCSMRRSCGGVSYRPRSHWCRLYAYNYSGDEYLYRAPGFVVSFMRSDLDFGGSCSNTACLPGQRCKSLASPHCAYEECSKPEVSENTTIVFGNMNGIGSKIILKCRNNTHYKYSYVTAVCQTDGSWSEQKHFCYKTTDMYMDGQGSNFVFDFPMPREECKHYCNEFVMCAAANFYSPLGPCEMSLEYFDPNDSGTSGAVMRNGWEVIPKSYPLYLSIGNNEGHNKLTFDEAVAYCASRHTVMASKKTAYQAHDLGFERCLCGWVSEGYAIIIMQTALSGCRNTNTVTRCNISEDDGDLEDTNGVNRHIVEKHDVFCVNPYF